MSDHERIWLQAADDAAEYGRLWSQNKVWPDHPDDSEPTEYVRADLMRAVTDASENLLIAVGMGWDLDGVIDAAIEANKRAIRALAQKGKDEAVGDAIGSAWDLSDETKAQIAAIEANRATAAKNADKPMFQNYGAGALAQKEGKDA
jgi:hypothetical protein